VPSSCALLGEFAVGVRVALLWQHSANAKCQRVFVLTLCLVDIVSLANIICRYNSAQLIIRTHPSILCTPWAIKKEPTYYIFLPCDFFYLLLLSSICFSLPNLSGRRLDVYYTSTHGMALVRIENACLKCAARHSLEMQDPRNRQKFAIWAPSHNFVGLYLRN